MTPAEFDQEFGRLSAICSQAWGPTESDTRIAWVREIRRQFESLDHAQFSAAISLCVDTHQNPRQLPTPARLRECYDAKRPRHTTADRCLCCGRSPCHWSTRAGDHEWMVTEIASMTPAQARRTLGYIGDRTEPWDKEILSLLREVANSPCADPPVA